LKEHIADFAPELNIDVHPIFLVNDQCIGVGFIKNGEAKGLFITLSRLRRFGTDILITTDEHTQDQAKAIANSVTILNPALFSD